MEDGELITFGQGASGRLGTGKMANRYETCIKASFCAPFAIPTTCLPCVVRFPDRSQQESQVAREPWISWFCYQVEAL